MWVSRSSSGIRVLAPAKLNLFLEILGQREDGYHEIETLMVPVSLYDTLEFIPRSRGPTKLVCDWSALTAGVHRADGPGPARPAAADNLAVRAVELVRERAGARQGGRIRLVKRIPAAAGLGGASSDAAAALVAANLAWGLHWPATRLADLAAELGSDVPFFLHGGAAVCRGRGERVQGVELPTGMPVVIVQPPEGLATGRVYAACQPARRPAAVAPLLAAGQRGDWRSVGRYLTNRLQPSAARLSPWIRRLRHLFDQLDCLGHHMSGSGTCYFGICRHALQARRVAMQLRHRAVGTVRVAATVARASRPTAAASAT